MIINRCAEPHTCSAIYLPSFASHAPYINKTTNLREFLVIWHIINEISNYLALLTVEER